MTDKYLSISKDFTGAIADRWTNTSREQKITLLGTAAILGSCWGFSKFYFWRERSKTKKRIEEERVKLRESKEKLHQELKNDKGLASEKDNILGLSFSELQDRLRDGKLTAKTVLRAYQLKALEVNPDINAIAHVIPDVQKLAEEYDANRKSLLLGGIPVTLKDHYTIKGRYATIGLGPYLFREAEEDCVIVKVLKKHGAIPYFLTTVPQMLMGHIGAPDFFKGIETLVQNSFGPMSRDVDGLVQAMRALWDGYMFDLDPSVVPMTFDEEVFKSKRPLRIGYYTYIDGVGRVSPSCERAVLMAKQRLESLGHQVIPWDIPSMSSMMEIYIRCFTTNDNPDESILSGGLLPIEKDFGSTADSWKLATKIKRLKSEAWQSWKKAGLDAVICVTSPVPAYKVEHTNVNNITFPFILVHNLLTMPAGVVPVTHVNQDDLKALSDLDDNNLGVKEIKQAMDAGSVGLPITVQVATPTYRDELCLRIMKEIEGLNTA